MDPQTRDRRGKGLAAAGLGSTLAGFGTAVTQYPGTRIERGVTRREVERGMRPLGTGGGLSADGRPVDLRTLSRREHYDPATGARRASKQTEAMLRRRAAVEAVHRRARGKGAAAGLAGQVLVSGGLVGGGLGLIEAGKRDRRVALKEIKKGDRLSAAEVAAGGGVLAGGFSQRFPEVANEVTRRDRERRIRRLDRRTVGAGKPGLDNRMRPVDPETLPREKGEMRFNRQGKPVGREDSKRVAALKRLTAERESRVARAATPLFGSKARMPVRVASTLAATAVGAPLVWHGARNLAGDGRRLELRKALVVDRRDVDAAAPAALVGGAAYHAPSYAWSHTVTRYRQSKHTPEQKRIRAEWRKQYMGERGVKAKGDRVWVDAMRNYPESLPEGRAERILSRTHAGKRGMALTAGVAGVSGVAAAAHQRKVRKDADVVAHPYGIPSSRVQPLSPLAILGPTNIMADFLMGASGKNLNRRQKKAVRRKAVEFAGAYGMLYSPLGFGRAGAVAM